jgi:archaellum component FlaC
MTEIDRLEERIRKVLTLVTKLKSENETLKKTRDFVRLRVEELLARLEKTGR